MAVKARIGRSVGTPTMEDVARAAGVSRALVSLVMRDSPKVSRGAARARAGGGGPARLPAQRAWRAASPAGGRRRSACCSTTCTTRSSPRSRTGIEQLAVDARLPAPADQHRRPPARGASGRCSTALLEYRTDGIILVSPRMDARRSLAAAASTPVVVVGRQLRSGAVDCVMIDEAAGARLAVQHLAELGHERIVHIDGGARRGRGAAARGLRAGDARARPRRARDGRCPATSPRRPACAAAERCWRGGALPTACSPPTTSSPRACSTGSRTHGVAVPGDVSIVGYDNTFLAGAAPHVADHDRPAARARWAGSRCELLLERIDGRTSRVVRLTEPTLVVRKTSGPAR